VLRGSYNGERCIQQQERPDEQPLHGNCKCNAPGLISLPGESDLTNSYVCSRQSGRKSGGYAYFGMSPKYELIQ
jgi:hypothetical protein